MTENGKKMTTKEWFCRTIYLNAEIKSLKEAQRRAQQLVKAHVPHGRDAKNKRTPECDSAVLARYINYNAMLTKQIEALLAVKIALCSVILKIENPSARALLTLRYLSFWTWEQIAQELSMDVRNVYRLHKDALILAEPFLEDARL